MDRDIDAMLDVIDTRTFLQDQAHSMGMDLENDSWLPNELDAEEQDALRSAGL
ncbi:MAG: hypothetical protein AAF415_18465 [Pseudomonadota bacterium]